MRIGKYVIDPCVVTYFIGNGFDLNLGLKTSYPDFLYWYANESKFFFSPPDQIEERKSYKWRQSTKDNLRKFRKEISPDLRLWADLEKKLGDYTDESSFKTARDFLILKCDLEDNLRCYLHSQTSKVDISETDARSFISGLMHSNHFFGDDIFVAALCCRVYLSVVSFNYTDVIGKMYEKSRQFSNRVADYFQIHGNLTDGIILGVDNYSQIKSDYLKNIVALQNNLIKGDIMSWNRSTGKKRLEQLIDVTNVYCIYGMSIGETDETWWRRIGDNLKYPSKILIIYAYEKDYDSKSPESKQKLIEEKKTLFCERARIYGDEVLDRIHVEYNTNYFNFQELGERIDIESKKNLGVSVPLYLLNRLL